MLVNSRGSWCWSELPLDVLSLLVDFLHDVADVIRFAAVCKSWGLAASRSRRFRLLQSPWQIPFENQFYPSFHFVSLIERHLHRVDLPILSDDDPTFYGFSKGYIMIHTKEDGNLLSDLFITTHRKTRKLLLPKVLPLDSAFPCQNSFDKGVLSSRPSITHDWIAASIVLSPPPPGSAISNTYNLIFCRPGDKRWSLIFKSVVPCEDIVFFKGHLYSLQEDVIRVQKFFGSRRKQRRKYDITDLEGYDSRYDAATKIRCFAKAGGKLFMVIRYKTSVKTFSFGVYVLDAKLRKWIKAATLGDKMLILDDGYCVSADADEFKGLGFRADCIYFTDGKVEGFKWQEFCLGDQKIRPFSSSGSCLRECPHFWFQLNL